MHVFLPDLIMHFGMQSIKNVAHCRAMFNKLSFCKNFSVYCFCHRSVCIRHWNAFLQPLSRSIFKCKVSYQADEEDTTLTISQQTDVLSELNHVSLSTLQKYGLDYSTAAALYECRPISHFTQLESFPGIGKEMLQRVYKKYCQSSQFNTQPLRPCLSVLMPPESVVAVTVTQGCICYCHLSLCDLMTTSPAVELLNIDFLPVETRDSKLHPHKLLKKVEEVLSAIPSGDLYVMPNAQYDSYLRNASAEDISVKKQLAQITGMVHGHLAMAPSTHTPSLYHLRDSFVHSLFELKVYGNAITSSLFLLHRLLQGAQVETTSSVQVPKLVVPQEQYERCVGQTQNYQHTIAPTLYTSLVFCALLHDALRPTPSSDDAKLLGLTL